MALCDMLMMQLASKKRSALPRDSARLQSDLLMRRRKRSSGPRCGRSSRWVRTPTLKAVTKSRSIDVNAGRRYFRLLKWQPCWKKGLEAFHEGNDWPTRRALNVAKWSFLGMYFFLEMFTFVRDQPQRD